MSSAADDQFYSPHEIFDFAGTRVRSRSYEQSSRTAADDQFYASTSSTTTRTREFGRLENPDISPRRTTLFAAT